MPASPAIRRRFADLAHSQLHYREAGAGEVLLALHASPGSSRQMAGLMAQFAGQMRVIAPDTPGNGDSEALPLEAPDIADLASAMLALLDSLGIERAHVYGSHTGAAIAAELALLAPGRVLSVTFDGIGHWQGAELAEALALYAQPFAPDLDGDYLGRLFTFCRNQFLFYPWYRETDAARRTGDLPPPENLHGLVTEVMKAATTYHRNYHAAFRWDAPGRLPLLAAPALFMASESDPLFADTRALAATGSFAPLPALGDPGYAAARHTAMSRLFARSA
jgi:pimeloyl-ACP methyl ester carboxylesterase